ncbi:unnamed protein product [Rotaria sp. Silwood1]|nr:unnamed protein product [Rotaria sp. Silwood1]CAF1572205.1 unnamed protein product [Rotaria sp. Silwood1]
MPNYYEGDENAEEDDPEQLLQMLSIVNEITTNTYSALAATQEQRYVHDALQAIDNTDRFALLNDSRHIWDQNNYGTIHDINTFVVAHAHHSVMIKGWKRDIEGRRDEARNYLISGENTLEVRDDETQIEVVATEIPTSPIKTRATRVPPVTTTNAILFPTKQDIIRQFTLSTQQKYAFMIITSHLDGENHAYTDTIDNQLLMCIPGCGGTGKSQLIRAITKYFQEKPVDDLRLRKAILELPDNKTEHLPGYLPLVPGMPVLLTENIATELGLSNGTRGIFRQLVYDESPEDVRYQDKNFPPNTKFITQSKYALVEFPGCKLNTKLAELQSKIVPIAISEKTFLFDAKELLPENVAKAAKINKKTTKLTVKRKALPLIPAYSMTTHKSQGQTLGKIIVDLVMPPGPIELASVYVPLSRVKRLDDLLIIRPFEFGTLQVKPSTAQIEELKRLDKIAQSTRKRFQFIV